MAEMGQAAPAQDPGSKVCTAGSSNGSGSSGSGSSGSGSSGSGSSGSNSIDNGVAIVMAVVGVIVGVME